MVVSSYKEIGDALQVKCGNIETKSYPLIVGKIITNCIKYNGHWISPMDFEGLAGLHGQKWRNNIKHQLQKS